MIIFVICFTCTSQFSYSKPESTKDLISIIQVEKSFDVKPEFQEAIILQNSKKFKEASLIYKKLLKTDINNSLVWNNLGLCQQKLKIYDLSEKCYQKAIELNSTDAQFYNNLASLKVETGDFTEAKKLFSKAIKLDVDYPFSYINLANLYQKQGDFYKSVENYKTAIDKASLAEFYYRLGLLYFQMKKFDDMQETFQKALQIKPDYSEVYYSLALVHLHNIMGYEEMKSKKQLAIYLKKLSEIDPQLAKNFEEMKTH